MNGIEVLNKMQGIRNQRFETLGQPNPDLYTSFVDHERYRGTVKKLRGNQIVIMTDHKIEYLKDMVLAFLLNVLSYKKDNPLDAYLDAEQHVKVRSGFGSVDDVYLLTDRKKYKFRIWEMQDKIRYDERAEILAWKSMKSVDYVLVTNFQEFYEYYVTEFGEVDV